MNTEVSEEFAPAHFPTSYPRSIRSLSTPAPCMPFRQAADTWGWMSDYLMVQGQPLTTTGHHRGPATLPLDPEYLPLAIEALYLSVR